MHPKKRTVGVRIPDEAISPEAHVAEAEAARVVRSAVRELDPKYREVIERRADATETEIAEAMGISVANVKIRAHRARKQLREQLACVR